MKILKIRFENIHSLRGEHEIDFSSGALAEAGLFAITGPTGSGKSTLLDVITLALYNKIARMNTTVSSATLEDDGGIMTRNTLSCFAEVDYECNGISYRSHWSVARNRNNNLNPRKQELVKISTGEILESGTKTPEKNQAIIGLSYDQFVKAIVIAQGEFSKLLKASRNERNKLLEDLTGAHHYRQIGIKVYERRGKLKREIEIREANLEGIQLLSEEEVIQKQEKLAGLNKQKPEISRLADVTKRKVEVRTELVKKQEEQTLLEKEESQLEKDLVQLKPYAGLLKLHDRLVKYSDRLREYDGFFITQNELKEAEEKLDSELKKLKNQRELLLKESSTLTKKEVTIDNAVSELEVFREKIEQLIAAENLKQREKDFYQERINTLIQNLKRHNYSLPPVENQEGFQNKFSDLKTKIEAILLKTKASSLETLESEIQTQRKLQESGIDFINKKEAFLKLEKEILKFKNDILENEKKILENHSEKETSEIELKSLSEEVDVLEKRIAHQKLHQSLEAHRAELKPHEPCPLCGALEHPYATENTVVHVKEELVNQKKKALTTLTKLVTTLDANSNALGNEITRFKTDLDTKQKEENAIKTQLESNYSDLGWKVDFTVDELHKKQHNFRLIINQLEASKKAFEVQTILREISENHSLWKTAFTDYQKLQNDRKALYEGTDSSRKISSLVQGINKNVAAVESLGKQIFQNQETQKTLHSRIENEKLILEAIVKNENLENLDALRKGILPENKAQRIRNRERELDQVQTSLSERRRFLNENLEKLNRENDPELTLETLKENAIQAQKRFEEIHSESGKIAQELEQNEQAQQRQKGILEVLKALEKDFALWKKMSDLIGDSTGNKFSHFVQELTLKQLISHTNNRLSDFSDRYFLDPESAEGSSDLYIFDKYMGNARRSIRTLSGGETFLVSLAMAFALSDIASRNIRIESLFIDEGFGTLDPDTLDQAITVLEKMQNESSRSIGIISHVDDLKKRITTQIQLEKGSLGYSELQIVT